MAKNFKELEARMSPERRARVRADVERELAKMKLPPAERFALYRDEPGVTVDDLRTFAEQLGGTLEITASFPAHEPARQRHAEPELAAAHG